MSAQRDETAVAPVNREDASQIGEREATTSNEPAEKLQSKPKKVRTGCPFVRLSLELHM